MSLAKATAHNIQQELSTKVGLRELNLFTEYRRACERGQGIVFGVNNDVVMMNGYGRQLLEPQDQAAMLAEAAEALTARLHTTITVELPSGARARMSCAPVTCEAGSAGGIVRAKLLSQTNFRQSGLAKRQLPGVIGSSVLLTRACQQIVNHYWHNEWLAVTGEPGAGKTRILQSAHADASPQSPLVVLDLAEDPESDLWAARLRNALALPEGMIVLRHIDRLSADHLVSMDATLASAATRSGDPSGPWVSATYGTTARTSAEMESCATSRVQLRFHRCGITSMTFAISRLTCFDN